MSSNNVQLATFDDGGVSMQQAQAEAIEFIGQDERTVLHLPTGHKFTTYAASQPSEFYVLCIRNERRDPSGHVYDVAALCEAARPFLREMLRTNPSLTVVSSRE